MRSSSLGSSEKTKEVNGRIFSRQKDNSSLCRYARGSSGCLASRDHTPRRHTRHRRVVFARSPARKERSGRLGSLDRATPHRRLGARRCLRKGGRMRALGIIVAAFINGGIYQTTIV